MVQHAVEPVAALFPTGQGVEQIGELALAFVLCSLIGLEREWAQKSAGLRTQALVGVGAALFMLVSKYGFFDVVAPGVSLDPSRVAAQIVSGIGFIGGGLIFVRGDAVRGLTTAAIVWVTCAVGMACGAGLWLLAMVVTAGHFIVVLTFPRLASLMPTSRFAVQDLSVVYQDGQGVLRDVLGELTGRGFAIVQVRARHADGRGSAVIADLEIQGQPPVETLVMELTNVAGVIEVSTSHPAAD